MALAEIEVGGHQALIERLLVPRQATRILLLALCGAGAAAAWIFFPPKLIAALSGVGGSMCLLSLAAVWGMRAKAQTVFSGSQVDAESFRRARASATMLRRRSLHRAMWVALATVVVGAPSIVFQLTSAVWLWMVFLAAAGLSEAVYSFLLVNAWDDQLHAIKDLQTIEAREKIERDALVERLESKGTVTSDPSVWRLGGDEELVKPH